MSLPLENMLYADETIIPWALEILSRKFRGCLELCTWPQESDGRYRRIAVQGTRQERGEYRVKRT